MSSQSLSVLDPTDWKLQLPVDSSGGFSGRSLEIRSLAGYSSPYFYVGPDGAQVLAAPVEGATTSGSRYARSELRQVIDGQNAAWRLTEGGTLAATLQVDRVPVLDGGGAARIVVGQVLSDDFDQLVRLYYQNGTLHWVNGRNEVQSKDATYAITDATGRSPDVSLDETFTYSITVQAQSVTVTVVADGRTYASTAAIGGGWSDNGFFFKAGVYLGSDEGNSRGWGQVSLFDLDVTVGAGGGLPGDPPPPPPPPPVPGVISDNGLVAPLRGTAGDDVFLVSREGTTVRAEGGADLVRASVSWTMSKGVETLLLLGEADLNGTGSRGDDQILGNAGRNALLGLDGDDHLQGLAGDDTLRGGDDDDRLDGGAGNDAMLGGDDDDRLEGGAGNDTLLGDDDDDSLWGGDGDDVLNGGADQDRLTGGEGRDLFVFSAARDSRPGHADVIADFASGLDRIDLSAIDANTRAAGDQAFAWNGTGAGRLVLQSGQLLGDVNGDGRWDLVIDLGGAALAASDLVL